VLLVIGCWFRHCQPSGGSSEGRRGNPDKLEMLCWLSVVRTVSVVLLLQKLDLVMKKAEK
jgi:hypothetical protein